MKVTGVPLELVLELNIPPPGLELQVMPEGSLVVAESRSCCHVVRPARRGEIAIDIVPGLMVRESVAEDVCALPAESVTSKVSGRRLAVVEGVPAMTPVEESSDNPAGRDPPVSDQW